MADSLRNCRILLVEDEVIIALAIEDMLHNLGCTVVGPAYSVTSGEALASTEDVDGAILDINLNGQMSDPIAQTLQARHIPFCFSTGYGSAAVSTAFADRPVLQKPYTVDNLAQVLRDLLT